MRAIVIAFCRLNTLFLLKLQLKFVQSMDAFAKYILLIYDAIFQKKTLIGS